MTRETLLGARVERGPVAVDIPAPVIDATFEGGDVRFVATRERAFLHVDAVSDFAIDGGRTVRVDPHPEARPAEVDLYLRGTVAALLLGQRGRFALHASLVRVADTVVGVAAPSGAGKSTTALALAQRGHELVADDFAELRPEANGVTYTTVGRPVHVARATAEALGIDTSGACNTSGDGEKLALPGPPAASGRLGAVVALAPGDSEAVTREPLTGARAMGNIHAFGARVAVALWPAEAFTWAATVVSRLPVYAVTRPNEGWTVDAVADAVEAVAAEARSADASRL